MSKGGCFCGNVRYEIDDGDYVVANCYCTMCRRTSGAPVVTWAVVPIENFRYLCGEPNRLDSSDRASRDFCASCGSPLACRILDKPGEIDITTSTLDNPEAFVPKYGIYTDTKLAWLHALEP